MKPGNPELLELIRSVIQHPEMYAASEARAESMLVALSAVAIAERFGSGIENGIIRACDIVHNVTSANHNSDCYTPMLCETIDNGELLATSFNALKENGVKFMAHLKRLLSGG